MGFRERQQDSAAGARSARRRGSRPIQPGQHHRRGPVSPKPDAARRPAAAAAGQSGHTPEPVNESALGWLVEGHHTLPVERGYFLDYSYRMHPAVCDPVSRLSYDGRLRSYEKVSAARRLDGVPPGVRVLTVAHYGNSTDSPERPTRSSTRSAGCSAPRGPTNTARLPWLKNTSSW